MIKIHLSLILLLFLMAVASAQEGGAAAGSVFPVGKSDQQFETLKFSLDVPKELSEMKQGSLVILLHGMGGKAKRFMTVLNGWVGQDFILCAPQATGRTWNAADLNVVERLGAHLLKTMPIDRNRVHVMGFSNGGWNLPRLASSDVLKPRSAVYVGSGFQGAAPPKWAAKHQGVLAVAGTLDPNAGAARKTPRLLAGKVRSAEAKFQPNLGHKWPTQLNPYMLWWMCVQEGRFRYGESLVFDWTGNLEIAVANMEGRKKAGILVYLYDSRIDDQKKAAQQIEHQLFFDPAVRFYVSQIAAVEFDLALKNAPFGPIPKTPCVAILTKNGKLKKMLKGKMKAKSLRSALKSFVPTKKVPRALL